MNKYQFSCPKVVFGKHAVWQLGSVPRFTQDVPKEIIE